jgi:hypothetical protein
MQCVKKIRPSAMRSIFTTGVQHAKAPYPDVLIYNPSKEALPNPYVCVLYTPQLRCMFVYA